MIFIESKHIRKHLEVGHVLVVNNKQSVIQYMTHDTVVLHEHLFPIMTNDTGMNIIVEVDETFLKLLEKCRWIEVTDTSIHFGQIEYVLTTGNALGTFRPPLSCVMVVPKLPEIDESIEVRLTVRENDLEIDTYEMKYHFKTLGTSHKASICMVSDYLIYALEQFKGQMVKIYIDPTKPLCIESEKKRIYVPPYQD